MSHSGTGISRRASLGVMSAGTLGMLAGPGCSETAGAEAFALIGDRYHNSDYIRTALMKTLVRDAGVTVDFTDDYTALTAVTLEKYKLLIVFRDGMIWPEGYLGQYPGWNPRGGETPASEPPLPDIGGESQPWITPEQGQAVREFVAGGRSALFYHNASHISLYSDDYLDVMGARFLGHPAVRAFRVHIVNHDHPITRDINDFLVVDEQHYVEYAKEPEHVLMRSENPAGEGFQDYGPSCEAGWAYEYGDGRVCFLAPGHMISALWNPEYEKLQRNAANWLLRRV